MRKIILTFAMVLFAVTTFAQTQYDIDFTQTRVIKVSGKTTNKAGHLTFDGNDHLSMVYSEPEGEYFHIEGNRVKINLDGKKADLNADKVKMVKLQRSTLLNCISGNWEQAATDNNAETTVEEANGFRHVIIKAQGKVPRGGYASVDLTYRMSDGMLVKMILEEANGIINTYEMIY